MKPNSSQIEKSCGLLFALLIAAGSSSFGLLNAQTFTAGPANLFFPVTNVGATSATQVVTVTNGTAAPVAISSITTVAPNAGDFVIAARTCGATLAASGTCTVTLAFRPAVNGIRQSTLVIVDSAPGSPHSVSLTGTAQGATQPLTFSPAIVTFPLTTVGILSQQILVQVTNYGGTAVNFNGASLIGPNQSDFAIASNGCTTLPASVSTCYVYVTFTPTAPGARNASLQINSSAPGSPFVVPLIGTAQAVTRVVTASPASFNFGVQNTGTTSNQQYITVQSIGTAPVTMSAISITGTNASDFSINSNGCPGPGGTLATNSTCYVYVSFSPSASGLRTGVLSIASNASGSPQTVALYGVGQAPTKILAISPGTLSLGVQPVGTMSGAAYIQLQNTGTSPVNFSNVAISGTNASDFAVSSNGCTGSIPAGSYCYVYVTFSPAAAGVRTASISFTNDAVGSPQAVTLLGSGTTVTRSLSTNFLNYAFGALPLGATSSQQYFLIRNYGNSPVTFNGITLAGANPGDFAISNNGCPSAGSPLTPGGSCYVYLTFSPSATGLRTATVQISSSAAGSPQNIVVDGVGLPIIQVLNFSASSIVFQGAQVGTSGSTNYLTATNLGTKAVTFTGATILGPNASDFSVSYNTCSSASVSPGYGCTIGVSYAPSVPGVATAGLQLTNDAAGSPQTIPIAGLGLSGSGGLSISPNALNFGAANLGATSQASPSVSVYNSSVSPVTLNLQIAGANGGDYSFATNTCGASLSAGFSCSFTIQFAPGGLGSRIGNVQITTGGGTQNVLLAGVGTAVSSFITLQPALDFGMITVGGSSQAASLQILNTGTTPITFGASSITGTNAAEFGVATNNCAFLGVGQTCNMTLVFTPAAGGPRTASLSIPSNANGSPQVIPLTGMGQTAAKVLGFPAAIDLGRTNVNTPASVGATLTNEGTAAITIAALALSGANAAEFTVSQSSCATSTIAAFSSCSIQVTFLPTAPGVRTATLRIFSDAAGSPHSITLTGVGLAATTALQVPSAVAFPATILGTSSIQSALLINIGTSVVRLTNATITGTNASEFSINFGCGTNQIAVGGQCGLQIQFIPAAAGPRAASLVISSNAAGSPQVISLVGVGQAQVSTLQLPPAIVFPATPGGTTSVQNFQIYNTGNQTITFTSVSVPNSTAYRVGNWCPQITAGGSCNIQVFFQPSNPGITTATLQFVSNASGSPHSVLLTGAAAGTTRTLGFSSNALSFTPQAVGTVSGVQTLYIYNNGTGPVMLNKVQMVGGAVSDYLITANTCVGSGSSLAAGANCYMQISFAPTVAGVRTTTLYISSNAVGNLNAVSITGTGQ